MASRPIEHIDHVVPARLHSPMYLMHKFWARKPHNVVGEYVEHYSREGEVVFDPFAGSGVTAIEALRRGRKAIAYDLDPMATFITWCTATPIELNSLKSTFSIIEGKTRRELDELYLTRCPGCGRSAKIEAVIWHKDEPKEIRYFCAREKSKGKSLMERC